ncbi:hypothetical protein [Streptomyces cathayae]|uniref:Transposase n=1 Tax=Streptomyces cathayae TaxID=3031124 RepID=A0ABY8K1G5_9ACTN|nr:hypothetical protein [Streptomyces sp. HUAS 5]WGD40731.1 hypothetical protein PYS65_11550 [Streptomyces sp. HUAS 5]
MRTARLARQGRRGCGRHRGRVELTETQPTAGKKQAREPALIPGQIVNREIEELLREYE